MIVAVKASKSWFAHAGLKIIIMIKFGMHAPNSSVKIVFEVYSKWVS